MKIMISFLVFCLLCCNTPNKSVAKTINNFSSTIFLDGEFEGTEPFWRLTVKNNQYQFLCNEKELKGSLNVSKKQLHGIRFAFKDNELFGVISKSYGNKCELDITEKDSVAFEIYLSFENQTYAGCGELVFKDSLPI